MLHYAENLFWRMTKMEITVAVKPLSPMLLSLSSGFVRRKVGSSGTKHGARRRQSRGISRRVVSSLVSGALSISIDSPTSRILRLASAD